MELKKLPWHAIRESYLLARKMLFEVEEPDVPYILAKVSTDDLEKKLGQRYFSPNNMSYYYYGEVVNIRRKYYDPNSQGCKWRQIHIRAFNHGDGLLRIKAHDEPSPEEHPKEHLQEEGMSWKVGTEETLHELQIADISYSNKTEVEVVGEEEPRSARQMTNL